MSDRGAGLSRRQFLILGGGSAAAIWVGYSPVAQALQVGQTSGLLPGEVNAPRLRSLPFADDFSDAALPEWNVRRAVSFVGSRPYGAMFPATEALDRTDFLRGRGAVLDLDGPLGASTGPGLIETIDTFVFEGGATYALRFSVAGSHKAADAMPLSSVTVSLPGLGAYKDVKRMPNDDFLEFTLEVPVSTPGISTIVVASGDAPGQAGVLLESLALTRTR